VEKVLSLLELRTVMHSCVCLDIEKQVLFWGRPLSPFLLRSQVSGTRVKRKKFHLFLVEMKLLHESVNKDFVEWRVRIENR